MANFENEKNLKASAYTLLIVGSILALCFMISWTPPVAPPIPDDEGMEVNLGDSETGEGDVQPLIPGPPSAEIDEASVATPPPQTPVQSAEKAVETNDDDKEAPPVIANTPKVKPKDKPVVKPLPEPIKEKTLPKEEAKPIETPPAPKPKYVYKGNAAGQGGNNASVLQQSSGQGIAGGKGDQGKINGDPNSDSYTGNGGSGTGGVSVSRGLQGRKINRYPSFEDDFSENAKVAVDIKVDDKGNVTAVSIQPRGTTTSNASMKTIALQKARQLKFNSNEDGPEEDLGTIVFNFRIRN